MNKLIVLDTTYVLPLFGINIEISTTFLNEIKSLWKDGLSGFEIYLPSVCLVEVMYKLIKEFKRTKEMDILDRYSLVLPTIIKSTNIRVYHSYLNPSISKIAMNIRKSGHIDLMDCMIGATATGLQGNLVTEDSELGKLMDSVNDTKGTPRYTWKEFQYSFRK